MQKKLKSIKQDGLRRAKDRLQTRPPIILLGGITRMQYINPEPGNIDWGAYRTYLESIRGQLPEHIYSFASDLRHFDFESHSSLHDAWLESFTVREVATGPQHGKRKLEIAICLLGPFHDLRIHLHYTDVSSYSFIAPSRSGWIPHGDLFIHEVRLGDAGRLIHELEFARDATFVIECSDFRHSEEKIANVA